MFLLTASFSYNSTDALSSVSTNKMNIQNLPNMHNYIIIPFFFFFLMKALANSFINRYLLNTYYVPGVSSGYLSGVLSFLVIMILNCSLFLTRISFCFTSSCLCSCCLCLEHASPICLGNSFSSCYPLFRCPLLQEATVCSIPLPKMSEVCLHWAPVLSPCAYLHHHPYHISVTMSVSISSADP